MTPARGGVATQRRSKPPPAQAPEKKKPAARRIGKIDPSVLDDYQVHPAAAMFPVLDTDQLQALARDIHEHGQQEPIWMYEGQILDGRNRLIAATAAGVTPSFQTWKPRPEETPASFVMSRNIRRRHLTTSQRAALATRLEAMIAEENKALRKAAKAASGTGSPQFSHQPQKPEIALAKTPGTKVEFTGGSKNRAPAAQADTAEAAPPGRVVTGRARDQAAKIMGVSAGYLTDAKGIERESPETFEKVLSGELTLPAAQDLLVEQAEAAGRLKEMKLRPGAVRESLDRLGARTVPKKEAPPPIKLPKATKVESSRTAVSMTVTFGNRKIAEEWLNRLQDDKRVLGLDYTVLDKPPGKKRATRKRA